MSDLAKDLAWCHKTQAELGAYYHGSLQDPAAFPDRDGARRGYEDVLMEEAILEMGRHRHDYIEFLSGKLQYGSPHGFTPLWMPGFLFDFQSLLVEWALLIGRVVELWSNPGENVLTPFMGVGSEVVSAVECGRRGIGIELKPSYYQQALRSLSAAKNPLRDDEQHELQFEQAKD
mgnify:CR=1 FL=1